MCFFKKCFRSVAFQKYMVARKFLEILESYVKYYTLGLPYKNTSKNKRTVKGI